MKASFSLSIYRRAADVVVVPQSGGGGLLFGVEPIARVLPDIDELGRAIEAAIAVSDLSLGVVNLRNYKSPVPSALGLRSNKAFETSVRALCGVHRRAGDVEIVLERRAGDGRGFEQADRIVKLAPTITATEIADAALHLMEESID